jgi:hypothetical protein
MVRDRRKYAFNPPKVRFCLNAYLPTYATHKSNNEKHTGSVFSIFSPLFLFFYLQSLQKRALGRRSAP